jgi:cation:H+ antiporter
MIDVIIIIFGLSLLYYGGEILIKGSVALARSFDLPPIIIGMTIVAFGTSAPEFVVTIQAASKDLFDVAVGNIIGSNISNTFLILGVSALICNIIFDERQIKKDLLFLALITSVFTIFLITDNSVGNIEGLLLAAILLIYTYLKIKFILQSKKATIKEVEKELAEEFEEENISNKKSFILCLGGIILLILGGELTVRGATAIAEMLGISEAIIGLTIVALGSSAPELASSIVAARKKHYDIIIGNVAGSNILNIVIGLGFVAVFKDIEVSEKFLDYDIIYLVLSSILLVLIAFIFKKLNKLSGMAFILIYSSFVILQFYNF